MAFGKKIEVEKELIKDEKKSKTSFLKDRYSLNFKDDLEGKKLFHKVLEKANDKGFGSAITAKHIAMVGAKYLLESKEELETLKRSSKTAKEKANENLKKYNIDNGTHYNIYEYMNIIQNIG